MQKLTPKQAKLLDYINQYNQHFGHPPSLKEMADHLGVSALSTVHQHLEALRAKGYIEKSPDRERNVTSLKFTSQPRLVEIPIIGSIAAGLPIEPIEEADPVFAPTNLIKSSHNHYALRVVGDSMIEDGIRDGDVVIIKAQSYISYLGQTIVAITNGGATLKRYGGQTRDGQIKLMPQNANIKPILADPETFEVRGTFVGLMRGI